MPEPPAGYAPLGAVDRQRQRRRRALFLQSYQFSVERRQEGPAEWLGARLARRLREVGGAVARAAGRARWWVGAGLAWAWRGWRPRADPLLGCFGSSHKYYLHDYA
ncbi:hypothetical protein BDA96_02G277300 [Sorghum bicolor]|uniref:Uncharacterized protein n=1 Tax=Sorghum bicolor TaxID=4558 RepID=A0A921RPZ8_SORBI|nr:hypothetical protein BDA96_02G277300 [Sorghum bicolor]